MELIAVLLLLFLILSLAGNLIVLILYQKSQGEMTLLRATIIKLKEKIQRLMHESGNKSLEFASAGHDICNSMLVITGLIDLCRDDVPFQSQLDNNLMQMRDCASKLLDIIKSVLDASKVEAGKMQLEEAEFDMAQVLEESVDLCHVMALHKGIDIIWDPCDFSVWRSSKVKGDCRRLKQILDNLLGNAVKFTSEGNVILRVWCRKPILENSKLPNTRRNVFGTLSRYMLKESVENHDANTLGATCLDPSTVEFVFEVDDTGIGIPKERRDSAFENYIQIKEANNRGHEGTGLGLGIVKSYVQLMGGDIKIKDKEHGEKGTCFRFNIFLKTSKPTDGQSNICEMVLSKDVKTESFHSLLFIKGDATRRILRRWLESLGTKVWIVHHEEVLSSSLEKIRRICNGLQALDTTSDDFAIDIKESNDFSTEEVKPTQCSPTCIVVLVDINSGVPVDKFKILDKFSRDNSGVRYTIIWLVNPDTPTDDLTRLKRAPSDLVVKKPVHGSRLFKILRHVEKLGQGELHKCNSDSGHQRRSPSRYNHEKPLNGLNILLVEDNRVLRRVNSVKLSRAGANVNDAGNGKDALELIKKALREAVRAHDESGMGIAECFVYDVILMDCEMPEMDGYEATRKIREELDRHDINIPIIAYTGHTSEDQENKAMASGMDFRIKKEATPGEISKAYNDFTNSIDATIDRRISESTLAGRMSF